MIKCADCGYAMRLGKAHRIDRPDITDCIQYGCNNYGRYGNVNCTSHTIEARDLINVVLADINHYATMAVQDERAIKTLQQKLNTVSASDMKAIEKEKRKLTKRLTELDKLFTALYEDKVMDKMTSRNYDFMSSRYEKEQFEIDTRLHKIEAELRSKGKNDAGVLDFISAVRNYQGITVLTAAIVNTLIDKITVSEHSVNEDGEDVQTVTIYYKFVGALNEHCFQPKGINRIHDFERVCQSCGAVVVRQSAAAKYCIDCAKRINRINANASKRRSLERAKARKQEGA